MPGPRHALRGSGWVSQPSALPSPPLPVDRAPRPGRPPHADEWPTSLSNGWPWCWWRKHWPGALSADRPPLPSPSHYSQSVGPSHYLLTHITCRASGSRGRGSRVRTPLVRVCERACVCKGKYLRRRSLAPYLPPPLPSTFLSRQRGGTVRARIYEGC